MLQLPATPSQVLAQVIAPTYQHLLPGKFDSVQANVLLLAIGLQEDGFRERQQFGNGPAHGLWQNEQGGGVNGVLTNPVSRPYARGICNVQGVAPISSDVWNALLTDDLLACGFARLILWCDTAPLPSLDDADGAYDYYFRNWRPGRPRPETWAANYAAAMSACGVAA